MKTTSLILLLFFALLSPACEKKDNKPTDMKPVDLTEKQKALISESNAFGFEFFKKITSASGVNNNMMVSPLSVNMALGMTRNGAVSSTLKAMTDVLGFGQMSDLEINSSYKYLLETFSALDPKVKVAIANSIWCRNTFSVEPAFIETNKTYFDAEVTPLNFSDPASVKTINNWVSSKTNNLIPKIIEAIPSEVVMYLINAVYFKGQWKYQFETKNTENRNFTLASGETIQAESMLTRADLNYYAGDGFEAVEMPYNQGNYTMTVILPAKNSSVAQTVNKLSQEQYNNWLKNFVSTDIQIQLPKFKFSYDEKAMIPVLTAMGMGVAFDPIHADFTRINADGNLYISEVKHKTFIETNEEGTEAAAVTSVAVGVTSIGPGYQPRNFVVDRPFLFFINEKATGTILFIGVVSNPLNN